MGGKKTSRITKGRNEPMDAGILEFKSYNTTISVSTKEECAKFSKDSNIFHLGVHIKKVADDVFTCTYKITEVFPRRGRFGVHATSPPDITVHTTSLPDLPPGVYSLQVADTTYYFYPHLYNDVDRLRDACEMFRTGKL